MAGIVVAQFDSTSLFGQEPPEGTVNDAISRLNTALEDANFERFAIGTQVQESHIIQITSDLQESSDSRATHLTKLLEAAHKVYGEPTNVFQTPLNRPAFETENLAYAKVVEYVLSYFPVSRITPDFQKKIEEDFQRFEDIFSRGMTGGGDWAFGWVLEDQVHEELNGEMARCFCVARGWESMEHFQKSVEHDAFKEAMPLLLAWKVPWKMVCYLSRCCEQNCSVN